MSAISPEARVSLTPRAAQIATVARELLEEQGIDALSMRNIAARLGIRAASLYEHFNDKRAVEHAIIAAGLYEQGDFIAARLVDATDPPIRVIARAYRDFALGHPALYRLAMARDIDRAVPDIAAAEDYSRSALRAEVGPAHEMSLALWAFVHGLVDLELNDRFPPGFDVDAIWDAGLTAIQAQLESQATTA